mmetsp:Transcript_48172/g.136074  ORF Transcript_48172/g.136074 Transcript_48172/m.136074 type:complete len:226 (+) Transcript_48172:527-1204(+)
MAEIMNASWYWTMPLAISWKTRDRMGGGMLRTPFLMFSTTSCWIHWYTSSVFASESLTARRLSSSMSPTPISSSPKALMSSNFPLSESSISASAAACSMLNRETTRPLKPCTASALASECLQNASSPLQASNHSARIRCSAEHPAQNRVYASPVRNMMENVTRKTKELQTPESWRTSRSWPSGRYIVQSAEQSAQGTAVRHDWGKTLPRTCRSRCSTCQGLVPRW